jgi:hypothetical protein
MFPDLYFFKEHQFYIVAVAFIAKGETTCIRILKDVFPIFFSILCLRSAFPGISGTLPILFPCL